MNEEEELPGAPSAQSHTGSGNNIVARTVNIAPARPLPQVIIIGGTFEDNGTAIVNEGPTAVTIHGTAFRRNGNGIVNKGKNDEPE